MTDGGDRDDDGAPDAAVAEDADLPRRHPVWLLPALGLVVIALVAWLSESRIAVLGVILGILAALVVVAVRRRNDRRHLIRVAWALPVLAPAAALIDPRAGVLLMPVGLACLMVGLGLVHAASVRERAATGLRQRRRLAEEEPDVGWRRDRASLVLILPTLALAVFLLPLATWEPDLGGPDPGWLRGRSRPPAPSGGSNGSSDAGGVPMPVGAEPADDGFDAPGITVDPARSPPLDPFLARRVLLEATPSVGGVPTGYLGPLYFRRTASVAVDEDCRWSDDALTATRVRDGDDGVVDGWCELRTRPLPRDRLDVAVHQTQLTHGPTGWSILHTLSGTCAVECRDLRRVHEGPVLVRPTPAADIDFKLVCTAPQRLPFPTARTRAIVRDPRSVTLPEGNASVDALAAEARAAAQGAGSDLARVRAISRHLHQGYAYADLGGSEDSSAALGQFVAQRGGTCEQFAEAAALMLRSVGIPSRIASGYLTRDWDDVRGCYVVRGRDSHAWVEVDFQGCGWVVFDPTPVAPQDTREDLRPAPETDRLPEIVSGKEPPPTLPDALEPPRTGIERLVDTMSGVRMWFVESAGEFPWLWAAILVAAVAGGTVALLRRRARLSGVPATVPTDATPWARLLRELARCGHRRRPSQTALEFAAVVAASDPRVFGALVDLTARQQAARFGGVALTPDDERAIATLTGTVAAEAAVHRAGGGGAGPADATRRT